MITNRPRVFLGGTCNESRWRQELIPMLTRVDYFDPVVDDWDEEAQQREIRERENCDWCVYVITPQMLGFYSIAEVVDDVNKRPERTVFCILDNYGGGKFSDEQAHSLNMVSSLIIANGGQFFTDLGKLAFFLNYARPYYPDGWEIKIHDKDGRVTPKIPVVRSRLEDEEEGLVWFAFRKQDYKKHLLSAGL